MSVKKPSQMAEVSLPSEGDTLVCSGSWTTQGIAALDPTFKRIKKHANQYHDIDASRIDQLDSAGAMMLQDIILMLQQSGKKVNITGLNSQYLSLLGMVAEESQRTLEPERLPSKDPFYATGVWAVDKYVQLTSFLGFAGEVFTYLGKSVLNPRRLQMRAIFAAIEDTGFNAMPIVALLSFLIGVVIAYQLAGKLSAYGADIFIVDVTGIGVLREFAPLITAVILAGRTSTAFAALIGTMKVNEEIDVLQTMGISPIERIVIPRVLGLIIALPLLIVWSDIFGILGAMMMAKSMAGIGFHAYLDRFRYAVGLKNYVLGLIKAPVFAIIISSAGCFQGFQVANNAESVGVKTTKAAVQAIFLIIIADAMFSIIFSRLGY